MCQNNIIDFSFSHSIVCGCWIVFVSNIPKVKRMKCVLFVSPNSLNYLHACIYVSILLRLSFLFIHALMVLQIHYLRSGYVDDFNFQFVNDIVLYHINNRYSQYYDYLVIYGHFNKTKFTFFRWLQKRFIDNITGATGVHKGEN